MIQKRAASYSILLIISCIVVLYHLFGYTGHFGYDDLLYAELASDLLKGSVNYENHFTYRFPVVLATALSYLIFGISDFSSSLPALFITFSILLIVFSILRKQGLKVLIIGLSLSAFSNWFLFYSDKLMPDIYVALSVIAALAIINRYKYGGNKSRTLLHASLLAFSLLFGFMTKGTIVLVIPLLLFLIITDIIKKRDLKFWAYSLISGIGLLAVYLLIIWLLTGDVLKRFDAIASNSYLNHCSYDQQSLRILLKRIFFGFFELSIFQSLATGFIFAFAILFQRKGLRYFKLDDSFSFFLVSAVILFLSSNFMTISPSAYAPMCLDPRHYLFLIPVAAIPASKIIADYLESKQYAFQIIAALFCITFISFFLHGTAFWKLYLPLFVLFSLYFFLRSSLRAQQLFILLFAAILLLIPIEMISYAQKVKYKQQRALVLNLVLEKNKDCNIICNKVQKRLLGYYTGFDNDQAQRFLSFGEFETDTAIGGNKLMLLNAHTRYLSGMTHNDLPYYARNISPTNELLFESKKLDLTLYKMLTFLIPDHSETPLLETFNDFENAVPYWRQNDQELSGEIKYAGARSNRISEYSSTFDYPLDSLQWEDLHDLLVQCSLFCYVTDRTSTKIIVSLENNGDTYFWEAIEINRYIKAYSNWWPVSFDVTIPKEDLRGGARLKVYVWNNDKQTVYIDNFGINITDLPVPG